MMQKGQMALLREGEGEGATATEVVGFFRGAMVAVRGVVGWCSGMVNKAWCGCGGVAFLEHCVATFRG
jgi:hypothetical protein